MTVVENFTLGADLLSLSIQIEEIVTMGEVDLEWRLYAYSVCL